MLSIKNSILETDVGVSVVIKSTMVAALDELIIALIIREQKIDSLIRGLSEIGEGYGNLPFLMMSVQIELQRAKEWRKAAE